MTINPSSSLTTINTTIRDTKTIQTSKTSKRNLAVTDKSTLTNKRTIRMKVRIIITTKRKKKITRKIGLRQHPTRMAIHHKGVKISKEETTTRKIRSDRNSRKMTIVSKIITMQEGKAIKTNEAKTITRTNLNSSNSNQILIHSSKTMKRARVDHQHKIKMTMLLRKTTIKAKRVGAKGSKRNHSLSTRSSRKKEMGKTSNKGRTISSRTNRVARETRSNTRRSKIKARKRMMEASKCFRPRTTNSRLLREIKILLQLAHQLPIASQVPHRQSKS